MTRRGFSLLEVVITLVVAGLFSTLIANTVARVQQAGRSRAERSGLTGSLRLALGALRREFESFGVDSVAGADHQALGSSSLTFRADRGLWTICRSAVDTLVLNSRQPSGLQSRAPVPNRDSLLLYLPGDSATVIDAWLPVPITVGPIAAACPSGGRGILFITSLSAADRLRYRIADPGIARLFETVNARLYVSAAGPAFGWEERSAAATVQPVASPMAPGNGLELISSDRFGVPTGVAAAVAIFDIRLRGRSARDLAVGPAIVSVVADSLSMVVGLRNVR